MQVSPIKVLNVLLDFNLSNLIGRSYFHLQTGKTEFGLVIDHMMTNEVTVALR